MSERQILNQSSYPAYNDKQKFQMSDIQKTCVDDNGWTS